MRLDRSCSVLYVAANFPQFAVVLKCCLNLDVFHHTVLPQLCLTVQTVRSVSVTVHDRRRPPIYSSVEL